MVDLSSHENEDANELLKKRPFSSLEAVRRSHVRSLRW
jgi:hypothetical protein